MPFEGPYDPADDRVPCSSCDGMGHRESWGYPPSREEGEDDTCRACAGRGWVREDELEEDEEDLAEDGE